MNPLARFLLLYVALYSAFGMASPFLPSLLKERGLNSATIGFVLAAGTLVRLVSAPVAARVADQLGALRIVLAGAALCSAGATLLFLGGVSFIALLAVMLAYSAALAPVVPLSDALSLAAAKPPGGSAKGGFRYGWVRGAGSAAFILGSLVAGQLIAQLGLRAIIFASAALLVAAGGAGLLLPRQQRQAATSIGAAKPDLAAIIALFRIPIFRRLLVVAALVLGSHALHDNFAVIRWREEGIDTRTISLLWSESVAAEVVVFFFIGEPLLKRIGPVAAAALSACAAALRWLVMGATAAVPAMALIEPLHGLTFALLHLTCMQVLTQTVPRNLAATAQAIYGTIGVGLATSLLTLLSGQIYSLFAAHAFWVMAGLSLLALPLIGGLRPAQRTPEGLS